MQVVNLEVVDKAEDFVCKEVELSKVFIVKGGMKSGLPSVVLRLTDGVNWYEADVTGQIMMVIGHATDGVVKEFNLSGLQ